MREFLSACYEYLGTLLIIAGLLVLLINEVGDAFRKSGGDK